MKLNYLSYDLGKEYILDSDLDLSKFPFSKNNRIDHIESCHLSGKITRYTDSVRILLHLKGGVVGVCSYSLEKFVYPYDMKEELNFGKEESFDFILEESVIDLDPILVSLIDNAIPLSITKKDAKLPKGGEGYRILSEEELEKERNNTPDPRWAKLDDLLK